jgi:Glycosyl hydrolases family 16
MKSSMAMGKTTFLLVGTVLINSVNATSNSSTNIDCSCGYYDANTTDLWTDSIIVYFNETDSIPSSDFIVQHYENRYEKGWNTQFREGAIPVNVNIGKNSTIPADDEVPQSLELYCNATTPDHLVEGGEIRTARQDIFFGSFRALFRGTQKWDGGSALSIQAYFNETQSWQMDSINPNDPSTAWVSMISHGQFPDRDFGVNYTQIESDGAQPWNWTEHRVDWLRDEIRYYVGGTLYRRVNRHQDSMLPQTPSQIILKHWSIGNFYSTQGPPASRSLANVQWVRLFFNSSLTTKDDQEAFASRCQPTTACLINNMELRGSSTIPKGADLPWQQAIPNGGKHTIPKIIAWTSISATGLVLFFALLRRVPWDMLKTKVFGVTERNYGGTKWLPPIRINAEVPGQAGSQTGSQANLFDYNKEPSPWATPGNPTPWATPGNNSHASSVMDLSYGTAVASAHSSADYSNFRKSQKNSVSDFEISGTTSAAWERQSKVSRSSSDNKVEGPVIAVRSVPQTPNYENPFRDPDQILSVPPLPSLPSYCTSNPFSEKSKSDKAQAVKSGAVIDSSKTAAPKAKARVDYLAGLVAMSSLLVTAIHFNLTFSPAAINPDAYVHNQSEVWARKLVTSFFLNLNWIGPFLMTSTRFLVSGYLRTGNLKGLAEKTVARPFRLLIPITVIAMLEYFFMDSGATMWLEYLASVTWSTWPFTTVPDNFGNFISEILELAYLIPNAAPQITFNYCTGVLWTIPVQLQGSWQTILAVIMVREIKTPWKRFTFYAWCILIHWYALSWATYFYLAIMLTDLDVTYDWKKWFNSHRLIYYLLATLLPILAFGGLGLDLLTQWTNANYATYEYGVHPDAPSGLFINQSPDYAYPQYYVPVSPSSVGQWPFQASIKLTSFPET